MPARSTAGCRQGVKWLLGQLFILLVLTACVSSDEDLASEAWGSEAVTYLQAHADAFSREDFYGALDFYTPTAEIEVLKGNFDGGPVTDLLAIGPILGRELLGVHLGTEEAVSVIHWPRTGRFGVSLMEIRDGLIADEVVATDTRSTRMMLQARPNVLDRFEGLFDRYSELWSSNESGDVGAMYTRDATIFEPLLDRVTSGRSAIAQLRTESEDRWESMTISELAPAAESGVNALYVAVTEFGSDPIGAVGVYSVTDASGCSIRTAVHWIVDDSGQIAEERRFPEVETYRTCATGPLPRGWWSGLGLPVPREDMVTHRVPSPFGDIEVRNGTDSLVRLLEWGLNRFSQAGLTRFRVDTVTFEPTRQCAGVAGKVISKDGNRDLFLCLDEQDLASNCETCETATLSARLGVLHELAHAWMLDHVDRSLEDQILEVSGRTVWDDATVPWGDRGVEYAAEVMAWGLLDTPLSLVRIGDPPCDLLERSFRILTGEPPIFREGDCAN